MADVQPGEGLAVWLILLMFGFIITVIGATLGLWLVACAKGIVQRLMFWRR